MKQKTMRGLGLRLPVLFLNLKMCFASSGTVISEDFMGSSHVYCVSQNLFYLSLRIDHLDFLGGQLTSGRNSFKVRRLGPFSSPRLRDCCE